VLLLLRAVHNRNDIGCNLSQPQVYCAVWDTSGRSSRQSAISAWFRVLEASIYGSFQIIQRKVCLRCPRIPAALSGTHLTFTSTLQHAPHAVRTVIGFLIKFLQISAFALASVSQWSLMYGQPAFRPWYMVHNTMHSLHRTLFTLPCGYYCNWYPLVTCHVRAFECIT
jgi:hypothetical protein